MKTYSLMCNRLHRRRFTRLLFLFISLTVLCAFYLYDCSVRYKEKENSIQLTNDYILADQHGMTNKRRDLVDDHELRVLFEKIETFENFIIKPDLDFKKILKRRVYLQNIVEKHKLEKAEAAKNTTQNQAQNDEDDDDDDSNSEENDNLLSNEHPVKRKHLIEFLQIEKIILKERLQKSKKVSVKTVIDETAKENLNAGSLESIWNKYFLKIDEYGLTNDTETIDEVLKLMATQSIKHVRQRKRGTQIKMVLTLSDDTQVIVKPMRPSRDYETPPDHFYFSDFERFHAEIASFHVDKLLGFYRTPPTVGRLFNITKDLWDNAEEEFSDTFFYSPAGNVCFTGHCSYYCDTTHAICGRPVNRLEGSVQLQLPGSPIEWETIRNPYRRSYSKWRKAEWETNENYCQEKVFQDVTYHTKSLLDLMDMTAFDFITGNMDRHHYERLISLGNHTFPLHLDNGRAFGKTMNDELSILAPIQQCCLFRYSTYLRFKYLHENGFSRLLDESMRKDPLYPLLNEKHLRAVDRRTVLLFHELSKCIDKNSVETVLIDDGY